MAKKKIAILGGGVASLTTAFYLASRPNAAELYDITIYQHGWRLGGKCATGRNKDFAYRIEEHGIHGFLGSYYNTLSMMAACYDQLGRKPGVDPLATFEEAFYPVDSVMCWEFRDYRWVNWPISVPRNALKPWEPESLPELRDWIKAIVDFLAKLFSHHVENSGLGLIQGEMASHLFSRMAQQIERDANGLAAVIEDFWKWFKGAVEKLIENNDTLRHLYITLDYFLTMIRGIIKDQVLTRGFDVLDEEDFPAWFARHGASPLTISSPLSLNTPNLSYQYPMGDTTRPATMAAGAYLHWTMREFAYLGSFGWLFEAGTGDTVVAPLYQLLCKYGVKFEFFHKVRELTLTADRKAIDEVIIDIQATPKDKAKSYDPLLYLRLPDYATMPGTLPCWPDRPLYDQLEQGEALRHNMDTTGVDIESYWTSWQPVAEKRLKAGKDFDIVVSALSIGAIPYLMPQLLAADARWPKMVEAIKTVQTQTLQIWMKPTMQQMGYPITYKNTDILIGATFVNPTDGVADFTDLIGKELWPTDNKPQTLLYFSGCTPQYAAQPPFSDHQYPLREKARVLAQSQQFLQASMGALLPKATVNTNNPPGDPISLDFSLLTCTKDDAGSIGTMRLEQQFWKANIDPTECYVTSPPGSTKYRIKAWESGFSNLVIGGDWIYTGLNVGSFEGACMGGKLATHAVDPEAMPLNQVYGYPPNQGPKAANL